MKADALRNKFLDFFKSRGHRIVESDSLVPGDDPTVLFTPAGMNQFKKQFLGMTADFTRAASSQRCLRTGDLDKVGKTRGHHTFFEMLGNFSFGDYFKEEAILFAWDFLTKELKIAEDRLWVSVYKDDDEAYAVWKDTIKVPAERIIKLGDKENFWPSEAKQKGPNGPCGPCSEIYFDQGKEVGCKEAACDPSCPCGRFLEIWNLVFTQFDRKEDGTLTPLPQKNIDTGMGLERLAAVMQGVSNNFETDLFVPIVKEITSALAPEARSSREPVYAIADHIRAIAFTIYDGVLPSNEGRGYVVRKLIRKSVLHLKSLGIAKPFLHKLVPVLSEAMKVPYPDLNKRRENIAAIILAEERNFIATLASSPAILKDKFAPFVNNPAPEKVGAIAFQLYDTYGIPLEVIQGWLQEHSIEISLESFDEGMSGQKARSKTLSAMKGDVFSVQDLNLQGLPPTVFLGYEQYQVQAKILKLIFSAQGSGSELASIVLDKTVFYPESGGQVYDSGEIVNGDNRFKISSVKKAEGVIIHEGVIEAGSFKEGDPAEAILDKELRLAIARNHTATHLLQAALRRVLGAHVQQQGSLVAFDRLRFDFTHFKDINRDELDRIEAVVNDYILSNYPVGKKEMSLAEAKQEGALAFFAEKYEESVRVISIDDVSKELCGGTHLDFTGQIGLFRITQEGSIASGIRRIEAVTGKKAYAQVKKQESLLSDIASALKTPPENTARELQKKMEQIKSLEKQLSSLKMKDVKSEVASLLSKASPAGGVKVIAEVMDDFDMDLLRKTVDLIREAAKEKYVIALGSAKDGKACLVAATNFSDDASGIDASRLIKEVAGEIGGSGGGRKDFAQAGGSKPENLAKALEKLKEIIITKLK